MSQQGPLKKLMQQVSSGRVPPWLGAIADGALLGGAGEPGVWGMR